MSLVSHLWHQGTVSVLLLGPAQQSEHSTSPGSRSSLQGVKNPKLTPQKVWMAEVDLRPRSPQTKVGTLVLTVPDHVAPGQLGVTVKVLGDIRGPGSL